jgi:4-amino-4-deoxy-L-arabinose transferase
MIRSANGKSFVIAILCFVFVYLLPIGFRPMIVPDEVRYAEIPREMIATGDWIVPRLNGLYYFEKPVLGYWITAASMLTFGENPFAVRFPSAMAAGLSALMVALLVGKATRDGTSSIVASLIFLTCAEVAGTGVFSVLDGMLAAFLTMAMTTFYFAAQSPRGSFREGSFLTLFGIGCGLAFLTKGFLAFAVPVVVIVPYMIWSGRWRDLFPMSVIPVIAAVVVCLPWALAVHHKAPDYWNYFFWQEHVKRFMAEDAQHQAPFWTYLAAFPVAAMPWSALIPTSVMGMDRSLRQTPLVRYALCWFVFPLLFFSAASGKLLTYILPCFAPFAILMSQGLGAYLVGLPCRGAKSGITILLILFTVVIVALVVIQATGIGGFIPYTHAWKAMIAGISLAGLVFCLYRALKQVLFFRTLMYVALGMMFFLTVIQWTLPDDTIEHKAPGDLLIRNADRVTPETVLVSLEDPLRAVCWYYRRSDVFQLGGGGELSYGLAYPKGRSRLLDTTRFKALVDSHDSGQVVLVGKAKHYRHWKLQLPPPIYEDTSGPGGYVFAQY